MKQTLMLINNPVSGRLKGRRNERKLKEILSLNYIVDVYRTGRKGDGTLLAQKFASGYDVVAAAGGDGTQSEVVSGLLKIEAEKRPPLIVLPSGTSNLLAEVLDEPTDLIEAAKYALKSKPHKVDIGTINGIEFVLAVSFGAFTDSTYNTPQDLKNALGYTAYILGAIKSISDLRSYKMKITTDEESFEGDFILGAICNCYSLGGIIKLAEDIVKTDDGIFEGLFIKKPVTPAAWQSFFAAIVEKKYDQNYVKFFQTSKLKIEIDEEIPWTVDGDYQGDFGNVEIIVDHGALEIFKQDTPYKKTFFQFPGLG